MEIIPVINNRLTIPHSNNLKVLDIKEAEVIQTIKPPILYIKATTSSLYCLKEDY